MDYIDGFQIYAAAKIDALNGTRSALAYESHRKGCVYNDNDKNHDITKWQNHALLRGLVDNRISKIKVGDEVFVFWEDEKKYFSGTVKKILGRIYDIHYVDGDREQIDLTKVKFKTQEETLQEKHFLRKREINSSKRMSKEKDSEEIKNHSQESVLEEIKKNVKMFFGCLLDKNASISPYLFVCGEIEKLIKDKFGFGLNAALKKVIKDEMEKCFPNLDLGNDFMSKWNLLRKTFLQKEDISGFKEKLKELRSIMKNAYDTCFSDIDDFVTDCNFFNERLKKFECAVWDERNRLKKLKDQVFSTPSNFYKIERDSSDQNCAQKMKSELRKIYGFNLLDLVDAKLIIPSDKCFRFRHSQFPEINEYFGITNNGEYTLWNKTFESIELVLKYILSSRRISDNHCILNSYSY
eukprot:g3079.t1